METSKQLFLKESLLNCPPSDHPSTYDILEEHYLDNVLYSYLLFFKPDNLYCFCIFTTDGHLLYLWFAKRSYISLYYSALTTPHTFAFYKKHFPLSLLSYRVALANRPYYMKGGNK